ncbi:uncharacterized protein TrAtP1_006943 [Trichoderma atroviride]|uniref:uncharacterized protein n=1 Tax=Hypocrea atroviridis TaxID=63577 RepID=UPI0033276174|nr:hypothetical protein TrAtP1_006943 [Trichoderma atroviride]
MVCEWTVHGEIVLQRHPLSSLFALGASLCLSVSAGCIRINRGPQLRSHSQPVSAIADFVRQHQVAGICSSQTKHIGFILSLFYLYFIIGGCTIGIAVLN